MQMLDLNQVAAKLGISRRTAEALLVAGQLPRPVLLGRQRRWPDVQIDEAMLEASRKAQADSKPAPRRGRGRPRNG